MKTLTRNSRAGIALVLAGAAGVLQAAGPLYLTEDNPPVPLRWDTSGSAIPVWTDGGEAFTFDFDATAADAWQKPDDVPSSAWRALISGFSKISSTLVRNRSDLRRDTRNLSSIVPMGENRLEM